MNYKLLFLATLLLLGCKDLESINDGDTTTWGEQPALPVVSGESIHTLSTAEDYVSVMGNTTPRMPTFPALKTKQGVVRGYVADLSGKPLQGAYIGIRSTATGAIILVLLRKQIPRVIMKLRFPGELPNFMLPDTLSAMEKDEQS